MRRTQRDDGGKLEVPLRLVVDRGMYERLRAIARRQARSVSAVVRLLLEEALAARTNLEK